jgi:hypothetical protein
MTCLEILLNWHGVAGSDQHRGKHLMAFGVHADHNPVQEISATFAMQGGQPGRSIIAGSASQTEQQ